MQSAAAKRSNGVRHKYKDLLEMQQKASVLLDEYYEQQQAWCGIHHERKLRLKYIKDNIAFMSEFPPIAHAEEFVQSLSIEQVRLYRVLSSLNRFTLQLTMTICLFFCTSQSEAPPVIDESLFSTLLDQSIDNHLQAMDSLSSDRWDCVYIPLEGQLSVNSSSLKHNVLSTAGIFTLLLLNATKYLTNSSQSQRAMRLNR